MAARIGRWMLRGAIAVLVLLLLVAAMVAVLIGTRAGRLWAAEQALAFAPQAGVEIAVENLDWPELGRLSFDRLALSDGGGAWLEVETLRLDWRPSELLMATAAIERIEIERVALLRTPEAPAAEESGTEPTVALPTLPGSLRVESFDIHLIEIAPAVAGQSVKLTGGIEMRWPEQGELSLSAKLREADAGRTALVADVGVDRIGSLSVLVEVDDAAGGVLTNLLAIPDWPRTRVWLQGVGTLADWRGQYEANVGTAASARGSLVANLADMSRLAVDGDAHIASDLPALFGVSGLPDLNTTYTLSMADLQRLTLESLRVTTLQSQVEASGSLTAEGRIERLEFSARAGADDWAALLPPEFGFGVAQVSGDVTGSIEQPIANLTAQVDSLRGPQGVDLARVNCSLALRPASAAWDTGGECTLAGASGQAALEAALGEEAKLSISATFAPDSGQLTVPSLRLDGKQVGLQGAATVQLPATAGDLPAADAQVTIQIAELAPFARQFAVPVSGPLSLSLQGKSDVAGAVAGRVAVESRPRWSADLGVPPPLQGPVSLTTRFDLGSDLVLSLSDGRLAVGRLRGQFDGRAALPDGNVGANARLRLQTEEPLTLPVGAFAPGTSELLLDISGTLVAPRIEGQARVPDVELPQATFGAPRTGFTVELSGNDVSGALRLLTDLRGQPLSMETALSLRDQDLVQVHDLILSAPGTTLNGQLSGRLSRNLWQGAIELEAADLSLAAAPLDLPLQGAAAATIELSAIDGRQIASLAARLGRLSLQQGDSAIAVEDVTVSAVARDLFGTPALSARAAVSDLVSPQARIPEAEATLDGDVNAMNWKLRVKAEREASLTVALSGTAAQDNEAFDIVVTSMDGAIAAAPLSLRAPLKVRLESGRQSVTDLALSIGTGRIDASTTLEANALRARLAIADLPLEPFAQFAAGMSVEGTLAVTGGLHWTVRDQSLDLKADVAGLGLPSEGNDWPPLEIELTGSWQGRNLTIEGTTGGFGDTPGRFSADIPLLAGARALEATIPSDAPLSASLLWRGEIGPLVLLLPLSEHVLDGQGELDLKVEGTIADPRLAGSARLSKGVYEHLHWGTRFEELDLVARGDSSGSLLMEGSANDGRGGTLAIEGAVALERPDHPNGWLTVKLNTLHVLARDELMGDVSADIRAEGDLEDILLKGRTTVDRMEIQIPDRLPPSVVDLNVQEVGKPTRAPPPEPEEKTGPGPTTRLDLVVSMPGRVFVRGRGLDSEWGGELTITGTSRKPRIVGTLNVIRGKFAFAGRSFDIASGSLRFSGGEEVEPEISVSIEHSRADLSATIALSGPVSAPILSLSSDPPLPDDEILARVIFGKSVRELTPLQSLQLAQSVAQISGALSGGGVMDTLRQTLGVDALTVDEGEDGPKVGVGKYLLDNVYVGVRQGATAGSGELAAEIELTPNLSLQSEIGQDARGNVDLNWHLDY